MDHADSSVLRKLLQSMSQNSLSGPVASSCLFTPSANDTCDDAKWRIRLARIVFDKTPCQGQWQRFRLGEATHGDGLAGGEAVDEAYEYVGGVLRVALDAKHVVADAEHLHAGLVRGRQHVGAQRRLPDLHTCMLHRRHCLNFEACACRR